MSGKDDLPNNDLFVPDDETDRSGNPPTGIPAVSIGADAIESGPINDSFPDGEGLESVFLQALQKLIGPGRFDLWLRDAWAIKEESRLTIFAKNKFAADWIRSNLKPEIEQAMMESFGSTVPWRVTAGGLPSVQLSEETETISVSRHEKPTRSIAGKSLTSGDPVDDLHTKQGQPDVSKTEAVKNDLASSVAIGETQAKSETLPPRKEHGNCDFLKIAKCFGGVKPIWEETNFPANDLFSFEPTRRLRDQLSRYFDLEKPAERQTLCQVVYCVVELNMGKYLGGYLQKIDSGEVKTPSAYLRHFVLWCCRDRGLTLEQINRDGQKIGIGKGLVPAKARPPSKRP